jgi:hypothetical protein
LRVLRENGLLQHREVLQLEKILDHRSTQLETIRSNGSIAALCEQPKIPYEMRQRLNTLSHLKLTAVRGLPVHTIVTTAPDISLMKH